MSTKVANKLFNAQVCICVTLWREVWYVSHYSDIVMSAMSSQITSLTIVYSTVYSGADQRTHQNSASLAFVRGIHRWPVNSPHKGPVTGKMFPFDDFTRPRMIPCRCQRLLYWSICTHKGSQWVYLEILQLSINYFGKCTLWHIYVYICNIFIINYFNFMSPYVHHIYIQDQTSNSSIRCYIAPDAFAVFNIKYVNSRMRWYVYSQIS